MSETLTQQAQAAAVEADYNQEAPVGSRHRANKEGLVSSSPSDSRRSRPTSSSKRNDIEKGVCPRPTPSTRRCGHAERRVRPAAGALSARRGNNRYTCGRYRRAAAVLVTMGQRVGLGTNLARVAPGELKAELRIAERRQRPPSARRRPSIPGTNRRGTVSRIDRRHARARSWSTRGCWGRCLPAPAPT